MPETIEASPRIKVIGVGDGGVNAVESMIASNMQNVDFIIADSDSDSFQRSQATTKIQLKNQRTTKFCLGVKLDIGRGAAMESRSQLVELLKETDLLFIAAGMGGGTGTGAAPVIAEVAREAGILTVGIVTKPFSFEGKVKTGIAEKGIEKLVKCVDSLIVINNDRLITQANKRMSLLNPFKPADDALYQAVRGISELIMPTGFMNLDYADVRAIMRIRGIAMMGLGTGTGEDKASAAINMAFSSPMMEDIDILEFKGVLVNITGPSSMTIDDYNTVNLIVHERVYGEAIIKIGIVLDDSIGDVIRVTVIATGFILPQLLDRNIKKRIKGQKTDLLDLPHIDTFFDIFAHPKRCNVCSFNFTTIDGRELSHHLKYKGSVYKKKERPECPNCHSTIYRTW